MCGEELPQASLSSATSESTVLCLNCGHENPDDNLACEACGADIQANNLAPFPKSVGEPDPPFIAAASAPTAEVAAPDFSVFNTPEPSVSAPAAPVAAPIPTVTSVAPASTPAPAGNLAPGLLKLVVEQGQSVGAQFVLGDAELLVGREDEEEEIYPDIDLSDQDAGYVHRKHATLTFDNGNLFVTHLGGSNKTRVNNKPVPDNVPTPIKPGDKIGFGKVVLRLLPA